MLETAADSSLIHDVTLSDRYDLGKDKVLLNGTQALIRMLLNQKTRDREAGLNTGGYVSGYRGSPLGGVDLNMSREKDRLAAADIIFQPGLNEDIAATAIWGTQQAELRGEGQFDGVFGLWYGKGPGVDRSGDVFRHANMAGTSRHGGVVLALGDDHTGESSTTLHQSDVAMLDAYIPVLAPAGVQEILDYGVIGYALSRFSGNWVGLKCVKETVESTAVVDANPHRLELRTPQFEMPPGGLNIRIWDTPQERESRIIDHRRYAAEAFAHVNSLDRRMTGNSKAKVGLVAAGKNWLDLLHALQLLGLDESTLESLGITTYKVGMTWPLNQKGIMEWAAGLELIIVFEEKRKLIEAQIKEIIFNQRDRHRVFGHRDSQGHILFTAKMELTPVIMAKGLGRVLDEEGLATDRLNAALAQLEEETQMSNLPSSVSRDPYFCSGCPHNTSTRIPEGSRAYSGIGCHYMVQWMDRNTLGFTHMGGEGANWIGEAPFSKTGHVFQNIGDGTYNHSGLQTIRAAVMSGVNMTYKILYNDAVAMTGGQINDGNLTASQVTSELLAIGIKNVALVYDEKEAVDRTQYPASIEIHPREHLNEVQKRFRDIPGVTAIVYLQTCAAEKRRRRKRGKFPAISERVYINTDVCEGCGDCGVQSNCVSIVPVETELGRKRAIDQSTCNMDLNCVNGFCPSFVTLKGAIPKKDAVQKIAIPDLPEPRLPTINKTFNIVITGVGGTGVVTIGAVLGMAAHLDHRGVGVIEMAGLAQKGGAVSIHCRIGRDIADITAIRVAHGQADCIIGGDAIVTASSDTTNLMNTNRTKVVLNNSVIMTGDFTRDTEFAIPLAALVQRVKSAVGSLNVDTFDASGLATSLLGDSIYSNTLILGFAWQKGYIPLSFEALTRAIELNGAYPDENIQAFQIGRWLASDPRAVEAVRSPVADDSASRLTDPIQFRKNHLVDYQNEELADQYAQDVERFDSPALKEAVALSYHKVLAIKDEYEVARLHLKTLERTQEKFEQTQSVTFHLSPPLFAQKDVNGRPKKYQFGTWIIHAFRLLVRMKRLRGTRLDPFRNLIERKLQRQFLATYKEDMVLLRRFDRPEVPDEVMELARLPLQVRGFGPVWEQNYEAAMTRRTELLEVIRHKHGHALNS